MIQTTGKPNPEKLTRKNREAAANALCARHKAKRVSQLNAPQLAEIVEAQAIRAGLADENGNIIPE